MRAPRDGGRRRRAVGPRPRTRRHAVRARRPRHASPRGVLRRFTATTSPPTRMPISAGLGLVRAPSTRTSPASTSCAGSRSTGRRGGSSRSCWTRRACRGRACRSRKAARSRRERTRRCSTSGSAWATCEPISPSPDPTLTIDVRGARAARASSGSPSTRERRPEVPAAETYPDDLQYHREHDWARHRRRRGRPGSPGTRRTRSASSSTTSLRRRARPSQATRPTGRSSRSRRCPTDLAALRRGARGQPEGRRRALRR